MGLLLLLEGLPDEQELLADPAELPHQFLEEMADLIGKTTEHLDPPDSGQRGGNLVMRAVPNKRKSLWNAPPLVGGAEMLSLRP